MGVTVTPLRERERVETTRWLLPHSLHLFHLFPLCSDGDLTRYRRVLVRNTHLAMVAERLQLGRYVRLGNVATKLDHALANTVEALLAAVFLDGGLGATQSTLARIFFPEKVHASDN